jgi:hypothetical protein
MSDDNFVDRLYDPILARLRCSDQKAARVVDPNGLSDHMGYLGINADNPAVSPETAPQ